MNMASSFPNILSGTFHQSQWVVQMNELLHQHDLPAASQTPLSIFQLPDSVRSADPAAYLPRRVAFGPYHHFRPELYKPMQLFKLGKLAKDPKCVPQLHQLADRLKPLELRIRACFDQSLEMDGETLSWVLMIDGLYLLELLHRRYYPRSLKFPLYIFYGKLSSECEIISDMLKLENHIPLLVLEEILPKDHKKYYLAPFLYRFSASVSPFNIPPFEFSPNLPEVYDLSHHLLHFLYFLVLLIPEDKSTVNCASNLLIDMDTAVNFLRESFNILGSVFHIAFFQHLKETYGLIQRLLRLLGYVKTLNLIENKTALLPSASELKSTAGITFKPTKNGIVMCGFDKETLTLTLPSIHLNGFSQVLLRNLVAFEAMAELNPPCLMQYIALMNGLLTNSKDLKILEKAGIVYNNLQSEEDAVELFNRVNDSTRSLKRGKLLEIHVQTGIDMEIKSNFLQEIKMYYDMGLKRMVEEINESYERCWRFKMKKIAAAGFKYFAILVIVFLIVLVIARFLCNYLSCPVEIFHTSIMSSVVNPRLVDYN